MVKPKSVVFRFFSTRSWRRSGWILPVFSFLTFIFSWAAVYPSEDVERWYARGIFPKISYVVGKFADSVPFSWLDVAVPSLGLLLIVLGRKRRWGMLLDCAAGVFLCFLF